MIEREERLEENLEEKRELKEKHEIDMCSGPILKKMLLFAFPLMCSGVLQLLFNAADIIVVGRFAGDNSLAAVGSTSSLILLLSNLFIGLSIRRQRTCGQIFRSEKRKRTQRDCTYCSEPEHHKRNRAGCFGNIAGKTYSSSDGGSQQRLRSFGPLSEDIFSWDAGHDAV